MSYLKFKLSLNDEDVFVVLEDEEFEEMDIEIEDESE